MSKLSTKIVAGLMCCFLLLIAGCNENGSMYVGGETVHLPAGEKLVHVTWTKYNSIWYLTRPRLESEKPTTYKFSESSLLGLVEGTLIIVEH